MRAPLAAVILCGGRSSRMGTPKADLPFAGEPLLRRVIERVQVAASPVVVVAAPDQQLPALDHDIQVVRDPVAYEGPLMGIAVGLRSLVRRADRALVCAVDMPFITPELIRTLDSACEGYDAAVPLVAGRRQPLAGVYATALHSVAQALLDAGERSAMSLLDAVRCVDVAGDRLGDVDSLRNVNTPDEYAAALDDG